MLGNFNIFPFDFSHRQALNLNFMQIGLIFPNLLKQGRTFTNKILWWISQLVLVAFFLVHILFSIMHMETL